MNNKTDQIIKIKKKFYWRYIIASGLILLLIIASLVYIRFTQEPKPDPASEIIIRQAIAAQLRKEPNELTDEDLAKMTGLSIIPTMGSGGNYYWIDWHTGKNVTELKVGELSDIKLLEKCTNLNSLTLRSIRLPQKDIPEWMKMLAKLGVFDMWEKASLDLSPLRNLSNLDYLSLSRSLFTNLKPLSCLVNLKRLDLSEMGLSNLEPLRGLVNLQYLNLSVTLQPYKFPETRIKNLEALKDLTNLQELNVGGTKITDLEQIRGLVNLKRLEIGCTQVSSLEPLKDLTKLEMLLCNGAMISNLEPLKGLTNLDILSLYATPVTDLEPLKGLTNLRLLDIGCTDVFNLEPLKELKNLKELFIENCVNIPDEQVEALHQALPLLKITKDRGLDF